MTTTVYTKLDEAISDAVKTGKITQEEANAAYKYISEACLKKDELKMTMKLSLSGDTRSDSFIVINKMNLRHQPTSA